MKQTPFTLQQPLSVCTPKHVSLLWVVCELAELRDPENNKFLDCFVMKMEREVRWLAIDLNYWTSISK